MHYYVGLDGGGTRTAVAVANEEQKILYKGYGGTINFCGADYEVVKQNMQKIFVDIKKEIGISEFAKVIIGSSSNYDFNSSGLLNTLNKVIPSKNVVYLDDSDIALNSVNEDAAAIIISGTGSMLLAKLGKKHFTVGGYGHIIGDEGSAYDIAVNAIKQVIRSYNGWASDTLLSDEINKYFDISELSEIIGKIYMDNIEKSYIAGFSKNVADAALKGDEVAKKLLYNAASDLFMQFTGLQKKCDNKIKHLYYSGSVLTKDKIVQKCFLTLIKEKYIDITVKQLPRSPEIGALRFCFESYKNDLI